MKRKTLVCLILVLLLSITFIVYAKGNKNFKADIIIVNDSNKNFCTPYSYSDYDKKSYTYTISQLSEYDHKKGEFKKKEFHYLKDIKEYYSKSSIILYVKIKNISDKPILEEWNENIAMVDGTGRQYKKYALLFEPENTLGVATGNTKLYPEAEAAMIFLYDCMEFPLLNKLTIYINDDKAALFRFKKE